MPSTGFANDGQIRKLATEMESVPHSVSLIDIAPDRPISDGPEMCPHIHSDKDEGSYVRGKGAQKIRATMVGLLHRRVCEIAV
jgi:hypothetical protein